MTNQKQPDRGRLGITLQTGDSVAIGNILVSVEKRRGQQVKLLISAPIDYKIQRYPHAARDPVQDESSKGTGQTKAPGVVHESAAGGEAGRSGSHHMRSGEVRGVGAEGGHQQSHATTSAHAVLDQQGTRVGHGGNPGEPPGFPLDIKEPIERI